MQKNNKVYGHWKIIWMELWDQESIDLEVPGYIKISEEEDGEFQFGLVVGGFSTNPDKDSFVSEWEGSDEMDEARGEMYGYIENSELLGSISFWQSDESDFKAVRLEHIP